MSKYKQVNAVHACDSDAHILVSHGAILNDTA